MKAILWFIVWAVMLFALRKPWLAFMARIGDDGSADADFVAPYLAEMTDHEIRYAMQQAGKMLRQAGALQEGAECDGYDPTRTFIVRVRPSTGSLNMFDTSGRYDDCEYVQDYLDSSDEDVANVLVERTEDGVLTGIQILDILNPDNQYQLWLSQVLADDEIEKLQFAIAHSYGLYHVEFPTEESRNNNPLHVFMVVETEMEVK